MTTTLPEQMALEGSLLPLQEYLSKKSQDFSQRHPERKEGVSEAEVQEMLRICIEGADGPEETERWWDALNLEVCEDLYKTEQFNNQTKEPMTTTLEPAPVNEIDTVAFEVVEAARSTTIANGFSDLVSRYDFGLDFEQIKARDGSVPSAKDLGAMCGLGFSLGNGGQNLIAAAVTELLNRGEKMSHVVEQIGGVLKLKYATLSNYHRTYTRTPAKYKVLPFEVQKEISTSVYDSKDAEKDQQKREELLEQALVEGWNPSEARSHRKKAQGHDEEITANAPGVALTPWKARYLYGLAGGPFFMSKECPVFEDGLFCVDMKDMSALAVKDNKFVFEPMEKVL